MHDLQLNNVFALIDKMSEHMAKVHCKSDLSLPPHKRYPRTGQDETASIYPVFAALIPSMASAYAILPHVPT